MGETLLVRGAFQSTIAHFAPTEKTDLRITATATRCSDDKIAQVKRFIVFFILYQFLIAKNDSMTS